MAARFIPYSLLITLYEIHILLFFAKWICYIMLAWTHLTPTCSVFFWGDILILVKLSQINCFFIFFSFFGAQNPICFQHSPIFWRKQIQVLMDNPITIMFWRKKHQIMSNLSNQSNHVKSSTCSFRWGQDSNSCATRVSRAVCRWRRRRMIYSHERVGGPGWTGGPGDRDGPIAGEPPLGWAKWRVLKNIDWYCNEMMKRYP